VRHARSARLIASVAAAALLAGCGAGTACGPLEIDVPSGWQVTRQDARGMQIADGTAGNGGTEAGTATAVFDIYLDPGHTADSFRDYLEELEVDADEEMIEIDGYTAFVFRYSSDHFAGTQENVFVPDYGIQIFYRAAYAMDDEAFEAALPAFHEAT
jgi:hypothetical protein